MAGQLDCSEQHKGVGRQRVGELVSRMREAIGMMPRVGRCAIHVCLDVPHADRPPTLRIPQPVSPRSFWELGVHGLSVLLPDKTEDDASPQDPRPVWEHRGLQLPGPQRSASCIVLRCFPCRSLPFSFRLTLSAMPIPTPSFPDAAFAP